MDNQQKVRASLKQKFAKYNTPVQKTERVYMSLEEAQEKKNVSDLIAYKLGIPQAKEKAERMEQEYKTLKIKDVKAEIENIPGKAEALEEKLTKTIARLKETWAEERDAAEAKLLRKQNIMQGGFMHARFLSEWDRKFVELQNHSSIVELEKEIQTLIDREEELKYYLERYKKENEDIINELRREAKRKEIIDADLLLDD